MATRTLDTTRTSRLLALMEQGDDAFNARDFAAVDAVHHPDMVAHIPGSAQPDEQRQRQRPRYGWRASSFCSRTAIS